MCGCTINHAYRDRLPRFRKFRIKLLTISLTFEMSKLKKHPREICTHWPWYGNFSLSRATFSLTRISACVWLTYNMYVCYVHIKVSKRNTKQVIYSEIFKFCATFVTEFEIVLLNSLTSSTNHLQYHFYVSFLYYDIHEIYNVIYTHVLSIFFFKK